MPTLKDVYDRIAPSRYSLHHRTRFLKELEEMAGRWQKGRLLNLGCGHGADFPPFKDAFELCGLDFSSVELELARKYGQKFGFDAELVQADVSRLPFADETFDWAIAIAVYHHLDTPAGREQAFAELRRVLKPGGEAFITVWNRWQPWRGGGRGVNVRWFRKKESDVPWQTKEGTLYRYYYFFTYPEVERLARRAGFRILKSFPESSFRFPIKYFSRNICLLLRKD